MTERNHYIAIVSIALIFAAGCRTDRQVTQMQAPKAGIMQSEPPLHYTVDLTHRADDLFHVTLDVDDLGPENAVYQFAATAPGTYQVMDIGRYVRSFQAFDAAGTEIPTSNVSVDQWRISDPERVNRIEYTLAETWDTPVKKHHIYLMCGTSIEDDNVLINGQGVFGYPTGMQDRPLRITIERPAEWEVGTALETDRAGDFLADDYDHVVDSPILMGRLSKASLDVRGTTVDIYTYSKNDSVKSSAILDAVREILNAEGDFLVDLPVKRYTFLFHFEDVPSGAWEHSYSSEYVYSEAGYKQEIATSVPSVVAHEFFHIITPLTIHSQIIEHFNFVKPVPSEHLWLYEGTTEWAAHIMQLRAGLITLDQYLAQMQQKVQIDDQYDKSYSLVKLALTSYQDEGARQYTNIYARGALVAGLLDIRLLKLSDGKEGLRELLLELSKRYGKKRAFDDGTFFDTLTAMTYPEIGQFFRDYVEEAKPLPFAEYYGWLGIAYHDSVVTDKKVAMAGLAMLFNGNAFALRSVSEPATSCGFEVGDELVSVNGQTMSASNYRQVLASFGAIPANVDYSVTVRRDSTSKTITCHKTEGAGIQRHVLQPDADATAEELALRDAWMRNLKPS